MVHVGPVNGDVDSTPPVNLSEDRPFPGWCCASPSVQFVGFIGERRADLNCEAPSYLYLTTLTENLPDLLTEIFQS
jgi:hypothetical protein